MLVRLIHGFGIGGEQGNAILITCEHAPLPSRGFYGSLVQLGAPAGFVIPLGIFAILSFLPEPAFLSWRWRVPFLLSAVLVAIGISFVQQIGALICSVGTLAAGWLLALAGGTPWLFVGVYRGNRGDHDCFHRRLAGNGAARGGRRLARRGSLTCRFAYLTPRSALLCSAP